MCSAGPRQPAGSCQSAPYAQFGNAPFFAFTQEQLDARFSLEQRKVEADLAATEARKIREIEESRAKIAAINRQRLPPLAPEIEWTKRNL